MPVGGQQQVLSSQGYNPIAAAAAQRIKRVPEVTNPVRPAPTPAPQPVAMGMGSQQRVLQQQGANIPQVQPPAQPAVIPADYSSSIAQVQGLASQQQAEAEQARMSALQNAALSRISPAAQTSGNGLGAAGVVADPFTGQPHVTHWIDQALDILGLGHRFEPGIAELISHESGGNPNAINNWDSNAKAGHPSQGLMQTIPGTFSEYALPGYGQNILDPVSNIIAGVRYALANYGKHMLLEGGRHDANGNYLGY